MNDVVGSPPDLSTLSPEEQQNVVAWHTLMPYEVGKVAVMDDKFYLGHIGFYAPEEAETAREKARERRGLKRPGN